ncbi:MAG: prepilin-type N-terminal cleavage/methylation domain-containing protein [Sulfurimonas sp.]|nr:prepilin-type N-terminal cleavage/methylation domain-containing protein [Sulfurimonas sp.]
MKFARGGFTLIELMISITILSIIMTFLYKSYASLNTSNEILKQELSAITTTQKLKKVVYLDFLLAMKNSIDILNSDKLEDTVFLQSSNSIHRRINPYIAYMLRDKKLYRLESLKRFMTYDLPINSEFDVDYLGKVESFRVYKSSDSKKESYLIHIDFKNFEKVLLKIKVLNEN